MRNLRAYRPAARVVGVSSLGDVFRDGGTAVESDWVKTSVSLRRETRRMAKRYAFDHDMSLQELIDMALRAYIRDGDAVDV